MLIHTRPLLSITHIPQTYTQREGGGAGVNLLCCAINNEDEEEEEEQCS